MNPTESRNWARYALALTCALATACGGGATPQSDVVDALADLVAPSESGVEAGRADSSLDATPVADSSLDHSMPDGTTLADAQACTNGGEYPQGPFGNMPNQVFANVPLEGYYNADGAMTSTTLPYAPTSISQLRAAGCRYALIHISAAY